MPLLLILPGVVLLALFLYWQLIWAEGAYLGRRTVTWLYDLFAGRYDGIKQFNSADDGRFLGSPLALSLQGITAPLVLDVATGTSRLPLALFRQPLFHGNIIALDNARRMLYQATQAAGAYRPRITWVWQHAVPLPFDDDTFDLVTCLEALEFMPDTRAALRECARVLKPGGLLLVTNRVGNGRWLLFGKTFNADKFEALLTALGQGDVTTQVWQVDYDLVWSIKLERAASANPIEPASPIELLRCPHCRAALDQADRALTCRSCGQRYPIGVDGVIEML